MPFDRGPMDDPNPGAAVELFLSDSDMDADEKEQFDRILPLYLLERFADWCYDQGFVEGRLHVRMEDILEGEQG